MDGLASPLLPRDHVSSPGGFADISWHAGVISSNGVIGAKARLGRKSHGIQVGHHSVPPCKAKPYSLPRPLTLRACPGRLWAVHCTARHHPLSLSGAATPLMQGLGTGSAYWTLTAAGHQSDPDTAVCCHASALLCVQPEARTAQVGLLVSSPFFAQASKHVSGFQLIIAGLAVWCAATAGAGLSTGKPKSEPVAAVKSAPGCLWQVMQAGCHRVLDPAGMQSGDRRG